MLKNQTQIEMEKYNSTRTLTSYKRSLDIIKRNGFKPIAVAQLYLEDTFVFETDKEATEAWSKLENCEKTKVNGWWYSKKEFLNEIEQYEKNANSKVRVFWLENKE